MSISYSLRQRILRRDGFKCQLCGSTPQDGIAVEVDHKTPVSLGGPNNESNLWTLCKPCNRGKGNRWDDAQKVQTPRAPQLNTDMTALAEALGELREVFNSREMYKACGINHWGGIEREERFWAVLETSAR